MGFETKVLDVVSKVTADEAYFYNGTMFVECTARAAAQIETILLQKFNTGIIVSSVDGEFAFDFV